MAKLINYLSIFVGELQIPFSKKSGNALLMHFRVVSVMFQMIFFASQRRLRQFRNYRGLIKIAGCGFP